MEGCHGGSAEKIVEELQEDLLKYAGEVPLPDDATLLCLKRKGANEL